ncbi:hypothetical protein GCM10010468_44810 [Actinocorallia longicatena]|uniref:Enoyl-ACP reductase-like protein n=1 Tax=Actinocorallia longicatena TaxID=111803 RepID=A0ABP6QCR4_9ACTN
MELFAGRGARVVAVDVDAEALEGLDGVETFTGDVAVEEDNAAAVRMAVERFGRLDAVVLNAGVSGAGPVEGEGAVAGLDHAGEGIRINALAPGLTRTRMTAGVRDDPALSEVAVGRIPLRRWAEPREQAEAIWFLASPAASYITGTVLAVDGGIGADNGLLFPPDTPGGDFR